MEEHQTVDHDAGEATDTKDNLDSKEEKKKMMMKKKKTQKKRKRPKCSFSTCRQTAMEQISSSGHNRGRLLLRYRKYNAETECFGNWINVFMLDLFQTKKSNREQQQQAKCDEGSVRASPPALGFLSTETDNSGCPLVTIRFRDGRGTLRFYLGSVHKDELTALHQEIECCNLFRQYVFRNVHDEPRVQVLLHARGTAKECDKDMQPEPSGCPFTWSRPPTEPLVEEEEEQNEPSPGYMYRKIKMRALPLSQFPTVNKLAGKLANQRGLAEWNVGVHLLMYRNGNDKISWHADNTQGEEIILSSIVYSSPDCVRTLCIKPASKQEENDDEQVEIFPTPGDLYEMDGVMQKHYLHSVPRCKTDKVNKRIVIVFRHGKEAVVARDTGRPIDDLGAPKTKNKLVFGSIPRVKLGALYHRFDLFCSHAHRQDRKGVAGNRYDGAASIVVSRLDPSMGEEDQLTTLYYSASPRTGSLALTQSHKTGMPVRVFRSSKAASPFAPPKPNTKSTKAAASYRFDGLYRVVALQPKGDFTCFEMQSLDPDGLWKMVADMVFALPAKSSKESASTTPKLMAPIDDSNASCLFEPEKGVPPTLLESNRFFHYRRSKNRRIPQQSQWDANPFLNGQKIQDSTPTQWKMVADMVFALPAKSSLEEESASTTPKVMAPIDESNASCFVEPEKGAPPTLLESNRFFHYRRSKNRRIPQQSQWDANPFLNGQKIQDSTPTHMAMAAYQNPFC